MPRKYQLVPIRSQFGDHPSCSEDVPLQECQQIYAKWQERSYHDVGRVYWTLGPSLRLPLPPDTTIQQCSVKVSEKMHEIVLRKRALQKIVTFKEQQILGTQRQLSAILRLDYENLDLFWLKSNLISFFASSIFSDTFTEHY